VGVKAKESKSVFSTL